MTTASEAVLARYARRNFWLNVLDGSAFTFGISLVSRFTVLPLIVERLTDARWVQGLIPAIFLPAGYCRDCLPRR